MSCISKNQSAIADAADQLFVDTADGARLNTVTSNLGLDRPLFGFDDDHWRAVARAIMVQPKLVRNIFFRILEICVGPQYDIVGTLAVAASIGDRTIQVVDSSLFVQVGTLILDANLPTEETVKYCFVDRITNTIYIETPLLFAHAVVSPASDFLRSDVIVGAATLPLINSSIFPTTGFPYTIIIDKGTLLEETLAVSANNTITNTLTCSATVFAHKGPKTAFLKQTLQVGDATHTTVLPGQTFIQIEPDELRYFPESGFVEINHSHGNAEVSQYLENDLTDGILILKTPLKNTHTIFPTTEPVDLLFPPTPVEIASVVEPGVHWGLFETEPDVIKIFIPPDFRPLLPFDASWLHPIARTFTAKTISRNVLTSDTYISINNTTGMNRQAGMIVINSALNAFYTLITDQADVAATVKTANLVGDTSIFYTLAPNTSTDFPLISGTLLGYRVIINPGGGSQEVLIVKSVNEITGQVSFTTALAFVHTIGESVVLDDQVILPFAIGTAFSSGTSLSEFDVPYGSFPALEDGDNRATPSRDVRLNHFPGPYIYSPGDRGPSATTTNLATRIPPQTTVAITQLANRTNIDVIDASLWTSTFLTLPATVRVGAGSGFQEDRELVAVTLKGSASTTITGGPYSIGTTSFTVTLSSAFPQSDGAHSAGYYIILDKGGGNEEAVKVFNNNTSLNTFIIETATTKTHNTGETVNLMNDVMTFDNLTKGHAGATVVPLSLGHVFPSVVGSSISLLVNALSISSVLGFPASGGFVWLNFGDEVLTQRGRIITITNTTHYTVATHDRLPTTGYPYEMTVGEGLATEEFVYITNNTVIFNGVTGLYENSLTFMNPVANSHVIEEYADFIAGDPEVVEYNESDIINNKLKLNTPTTLATRHGLNEHVMFSSAESVSLENGSSYGFKMPPDPSLATRLLFDLVRAAGVRIVIVTHR